ncbi:MAG TPA: hypothetical protein VME23_03055 [Terracidiphilus sp.]|nr:hypothetical protein [Terracidiphilus sp.]
MQPANQDATAAIRLVNDILKVALPVLAMIAAALGISGDKWNKEKRRPTSVGYASLVTAALVAIVSIASWRTDTEVKKLDSATSDSRQAAAVEEQKKADDAHFEQTVSDLRTIITSLTQTSSAQQTTISLALRQLPIDEIELMLRRTEIESALPEELRSETFSFQKPQGDLAFSKSDEGFALLFDITSRERSGDTLGALRFGKQAVDSFHSAVQHICQIEITPASIPNVGINSHVRIGRESYLSFLVLDRDVLNYYFAPDAVPAAYYYGSKARLEIRRPVVAALGDAPLPKVESCVVPDEIRLRIRSFGFDSDTGWFKVHWTHRYDGFVALSPVLNFTTSTSQDQPPPSRSR